MIYEPAPVKLKHYNVKEDYLAGNVWVSKEFIEDSYTKIEILSGNGDNVLISEKDKQISIATSSRHGVITTWKRTARQATYTLGLSTLQTEKNRIAAKIFNEAYNTSVKRPPY